MCVMDPSSGRTAGPIRGTSAGRLAASGSDVTVSPAASYISLLRDGRKFAIVQVRAKHLDVGIKLRGAPTTPRFEPAGNWNRMVTRV